MNSTNVDSILGTTFRWVCETSLAASVLIGVLLVLQLLFRKSLSPRWHYGLWLLVVARLLLPTSPPSRFSIFNLTKLARNSTSSRREQANPKPLTGQPAPVQLMAVPASPTVSAPLPEASSIARPIQRQSVFGIETIEVGWLIGASVYFLSLLVQHFSLARRLRGCTRVADNRVLELLKDAARTLGMRHRVSVCLTDDESPPAVFGLIRPRLLLPKKVVNTLSDAELRLVILHELVHLRHRDVLVNWIVILTQSLHWFNPAVWFATRKLRSEREVARDAEVLSLLDVPGRRAYGHTLIRLLEHFSTPVVPSSLAPILSHHHDIERRITMIARFKPQRRIVGTILALMTLTALGILTFTRASEIGTAEPPPTSSGTNARSQSFATAIIPTIQSGRESAVPVTLWVATNGAPIRASDNDARYRETQMQLIRSDSVLDPVIKELRLTEVWSNKFGSGAPLTTEQARNKLRNLMEIRTITNTLLLDIRVYSDSPEEAAQIARSIAANYYVYRSNLESRSTLSGIEQLREELRKKTEEVELLQTNVNRLRQSLDITDPDATFLVESETYRARERQRVEFETRLRGERNQLEGLLKLNDEDRAQALITALPQGDMRLSELLAQNNLLEQALVKAESIGGEQNPEVVHARAALAKNKEQIARAVKGILDGLAQRVESDKATLASIAAELTEARKIDQDKLTRSGPYFDAKRKLDDATKFRNALQMKYSAAMVDWFQPKTNR